MNGADFEKLVSQTLSSKGWWSYRTPLRKGQPFDLITCKDGKCVMYEMKHRDKKTFSLSDVEINQIASIQALAQANIPFYFIIGNDEGAWIFPAAKIYDLLTQGVKSIKYEQEGELWAKW